jgi:hypothetical protein
MYVGFKSFSKILNFSWARLFQNSGTSRPPVRHQNPKYLPNPNNPKYLAFSKQKILRFWGLTGQRGWARLILDRLHDLVLYSGDFKGSTLDLSTVAHEHHSFFFPDNGHCAANAAGFGWRNGG